MEAISVLMCSWIYLRPLVSDWKFRIEAIKKDWKPTFACFVKARKRIETLFSQFCDRFMIERNYAKDKKDCLPELSVKLAH